MSEKLISVGQLLESLSGLSDNVQVTFGSSRSSQRPLVFYRFKSRGDDLLQIELSELDDDELSENQSELDSRITVKRLREELAAWKSSDNITFGSTIDGLELYPKDPTVVFSMNLDQLV